jgi:hypothetical protein
VNLTNDELAHDPSHKDQTCPGCGLTEARGDYCTRCQRKTGPDYWHGLRDGRAVSLAKARSTAHQHRAEQAPEAEIPGDSANGGISGQPATKTAAA